MAGLDFTEKMQKATERMGIDNGVSLEHMLGTGLMQPFSGSNSGARNGRRFTNYTNSTCYDGI